MPVHQKFVDYPNYWPYHGPSNRITCQSRKFKYEGVQTGDTLKVVSHYRENGHIHAEYLAFNDRKISGLYRKHGILRSFWPNGLPQATEYFCNGFPVGFHQYLDKQGKLKYVVDYSGSDYELKKRGGHRIFYLDNTRFSFPGSPNGSQLFREVYAIEEGRAIHKAFWGAGIFHLPWTPLDPASNFVQWTTPGDQGLLFVNGRQVRIVNEDLDYLSFAEVYQRHQQGLPGLRSPQPFHPEILACPWIDEAMRLGLEDPRFKLKPIAAISAAERAASTEGRFAACIAHPNADCLFEHAADGLRFEGPHWLTDIQGFARSALSGGHPRWARQAMEGALAKTEGFRLPNPLFAERAALKAEAEFALGLDQEAERSLGVAYSHATTEGTGHARDWDRIAGLMAVGSVWAKQADMERTRQVYIKAVAEGAPKALDIMAALGVALARQGQPDAALKLADEFFPAETTSALNNPSNPSFPTPSKLPSIAEADARLYLQALIGLMKGRFKRGDVMAARELFQEIDGHPLDSDSASRLSLVFAEMGEAERATRITQHIYKWRYGLWIDTAAALCQAGRKEAGTKLVAQVGAFSSSSGIDKATHLANLARGETLCGDPRKGRKTFERARKIAAAIPCCASDVISDYAGRMLALVRANRLEAGIMDGLDKPEPYDDPTFALQVAFERMRKGDTAGALARLDELGPREPTQYPRQYYIYNQYRLYENLFPQIRAEVLSLLGRKAEAGAELAQARRLALEPSGIGGAESRASGLTQVARVYLRLGQTGEARALVREALENIAAIGMSDAATTNHYGRDVYPAIAEVLAQVGADEEARAVAAALKETYPDHFARRSMLADGRARILGEVAVSRFRAGRAIGGLDALDTIQPARLRLGFRLAAAEIANQWEDKAALEALRPSLAQEIQTMAASLDTGMGGQARRLAIHRYARLLRSGFVPLMAAERSGAFRQLVEEAHRLGAKESANALCELGYTAKKLDLREESARLLAEGLSLTSKAGGPASATLGACGFWLKVAGEEARSREAMGALLKGIDGNNPTPEQRDGLSLLGYAVAYAEYEAGEILGLDGTRLLP